MGCWQKPNKSKGKKEKGSKRSKKGKGPKEGGGKKEKKKKGKGPKEGGGKKEKKNKGRGHKGSPFRAELRPAPTTLAPADSRMLPGLFKVIGLVAGIALSVLVVARWRATQQVNAAMARQAHIAPLLA